MRITYIYADSDTFYNGKSFHLIYVISRNMFFRRVNKIYWKTSERGSMSADIESQMHHTFMFVTLWVLFFLFFSFGVLGEAGP